MKKDKLLLITGVSGMLGNSLANELTKKGIKFVGCDIKKPQSKSANFVFEQVDLTNKQAVLKLFEKYSFGCVIHLAAYIKSFTESKEEKKNLFNANVDATSNLVLACHNHKINKFIFASSMTVYGLPESLPVTEEHPKNPMDYYGKTKLMAENKIKETKIEHTILRFPGIISKNRHTGAIYNFFTKAKENKDIYITAKIPTPWEIIDLQDATVALTTAIESKEAKGVFNIGYGQSTDIVSLVKKIVKIVDSKSKVINDYEIEHPAFYLDNRKAKRVLKINFPSLDSRLKEYAE